MNEATDHERAAEEAKAKIESRARAVLQQVATGSDRLRTEIVTEDGHGDAWSAHRDDLGHGFERSGEVVPRAIVELLERSDAIEAAAGYFVATDAGRRLLDE
jgi:hypothetical protein